MALQILVVDADAGAAEASRALVQHLVPTASVVREPTPERALAAAQRTPPDLLLIDPAPYPSMATVLIQLCNEWWPDTRIIVLSSARLSPVQMQQCRVDASLEKPASPARLLDALRRVLAVAHAVAI